MEVCVCARVLWCVQGCVHYVEVCVCVCACVEGSVYAGRARGPHSSIYPCLSLAILYHFLSYSFEARSLSEPGTHIVFSQLGQKPTKPPQMLPSPPLSVTALQVGPGHFAGHTGAGSSCLPARAPSHWVVSGASQGRGLPFPSSCITAHPENSERRELQIPKKYL